MAWQCQHAERADVPVRSAERTRRIPRNAWQMAETGSATLPPESQWPTIIGSIEDNVLAVVCGKILIGVHRRLTHPSRR